MELLNEPKKEFVRIIIGMSKRGFTGITKPIRTIQVSGTDVTQIYELIFDSIQEQQKRVHKNEIQRGKKKRKNDKSK